MAFYCDFIVLVTFLLDLFYVCLNYSCIFYFPLDSCFQMSLTHRKPPMFCQNGYLKQQGLTAAPQPEHVLGEPVVTAKDPASGLFGVDNAFSRSLGQAEASLSSGLKLHV